MSAPRKSRTKPKMSSSTKRQVATVQQGLLAAEPERPRYVKPSPLADGQTGFYFQVPERDKKAGCPVHSRPLGTDRDEAYRIAKEVLLPQLDAWRANRDIVAATAIDFTGRLRWLVDTYKHSSAFIENIVEIRRSNMENLFDRVLAHKFRSGPFRGEHFGDVSLGDIRVSLIYTLKDELLVDMRRARDLAKLARKKAREASGAEVEEDDESDSEVDPDARSNGQDPYGSTTVKRMMQNISRAWTALVERETESIPLYNPFQRLKELKWTGAKVAAATPKQVASFVRAADELGYSSLGDAALVSWCLFQRMEDVLGRLEVKHYRPAKRPNEIRIISQKTKDEAWLPLLDAEGEALFPELMARLDAAKGVRTKGLLVTRVTDKNQPKVGVSRSWFSKSGSYGYARAVVRKIRKKAKLPDDISMRSFRHGGLTDAGNAGATIFEIAAVSGHQTLAVLVRYVKRSHIQVFNLVHKRNALAKAYPLNENKRQAAAVSLLAKLAA